MAARWSAHVSDRQLRTWVARGYSTERIASILGSTPQSVASRIQAIWARCHHGPEHNDPDPQAIRRMCLEFQESWSDEERRRRAGYRGDGVTPTVVPASAIESGRP